MAGGAIVPPAGGPGRARLVRLPLLGLLVLGCADGRAADADGPPPVAPAVANDNRAPAGTVRRGVRHVRLETRLAAWRPDSGVDSSLTVRAFAEVGRAPSIPGPLLRVEEGTELYVTLHNRFADSAIVVRGLRAGTVADDTLHVAPGGTREVRVRAAAPGTYLYWASTNAATIGERSGRQSQLTGALVVDPRGVRPDTAERIFVVTLVDILPDTLRPPPLEDVFELAINGRSWPHTERLHYTVGDTVRWRWINGSEILHPMHLHGFHFRLLAEGDGRADRAYPPEATRMAVTALLQPGATARMEWVPTRPGHWLMHCHMAAHMTPFPSRPDSVRHGDAHDVERHPVSAMAGLVLGITTVVRPGAAEPPEVLPTSPALRLFVQQARADGGRRAARGFVLQRGAEPAADSVVVPGEPLVLVRGQPTVITVVNRLPEPSTVHWHGMELTSVYDGVSGWSGTEGRRAPLVLPGDSFTVAITPPRAGTYIYHTHMDEEDQLAAGLYGPLIVLEPGERWDSATDLPVVIGQVVGATPETSALNGAPTPAPRTLRAGTSYRLRLINIMVNSPAKVTLRASDATAHWRPVSRDGADLPAALRTDGPATVLLGVGETFDARWTPTAPGEYLLDVEVAPELQPLRQLIRVLPAGSRTNPR